MMKSTFFYAAAYGSLRGALDAYLSQFERGDLTKEEFIKAVRRVSAASEMYLDKEVQEVIEPWDKDEVAG